MVLDAVQSLTRDLELAVGSMNALMNGLPTLEETLASFDRRSEDMLSKLKKIQLETEVTAKKFHREVSQVRRSFALITSGLATLRNMGGDVRRDLRLYYEISNSIMGVMSAIAMMKMASGDLLMMLTGYAMMMVQVSSIPKKIETERLLAESEVKALSDREVVWELS